MTMANPVCNGCSEPPGQGSLFLSWPAKRPGSAKNKNKNQASLTGLLLGEKAKQAAGLRSFSANWESDMALRSGKRRELQAPEFLKGGKGAKDARWSRHSGAGIFSLTKRRSACFSLPRAGVHKTYPSLVWNPYHMLFHTTNSDQKTFKKNFQTKMPVSRLKTSPSLHGWFSVQTQRELDFRKPNIAAQPPTCTGFDLLGPDTVPGESIQLLLVYSQDSSLGAV